jgi:hypothetical protein
MLMQSALQQTFDVVDPFEVIFRMMGFAVPVMAILGFFVIFGRGDDDDNPVRWLAMALAYIVAGPFMGLWWLVTFRRRRRVEAAGRESASTFLLNLHGEFDSWLREHLLSAQIAALDGNEAAKAHASELERALLANAKATVSVEDRARQRGAALDREGEESAIRERWDALKSLGV